MRKLLAVGGAAAASVLLCVTLPSVAGAGAAAGGTGSIAGRILGPQGDVVAGSCAVMYTPTEIVQFPVGTNGFYKGTGLSGNVEIVGQICSGSSTDGPVVYNGHPGLEGNPAIDQDIDVTGGSHTTGIDINLVPGGTINVTVTDTSTGQPVQGAEVCPYLPSLDAANNQAQSGYCNFTGASGVVSLANVVAGPNVVEVFGPSGYNTVYYNGQSSFASANRVNVGAKLTSNIAVGLTPTGGD
jgi:hypothetical protein